MKKVIESQFSKATTRRRFLKNCGIGALSIAASGSFAATNRKTQKLRAGVAKREVTPPIWIPYLTSSGNGTSAPFKGLHDKLHARALVLDDGKQAVAILSIDSIGYDNALLGKGKDFTFELRKRISEATGLKPDAIMIASTHSHSTPETICLSNFREVPGVQKWLNDHFTILAETVAQAWKKRVPVKTFSGKTQVKGIARHRRILLKSGKLNVHGTVPSADQIAITPEMDEDLSLLYFEKQNGKPHSVLMNFTAHPVVAMLLPEISADYPGVACAEVEEALDGAICLFTNGAAGNVNSTKVSTNFDDVFRIGQTLGRAALTEIERIKIRMPLDDTTIRFHSESIELAPRECPPLAEAERLANLDPSPANQKILRLAKKLAEGRMHAELQVMQLGPLKWISLPGEAFVESGLAMKKAGASFVVGYANGWLGYFPIRRAYDEGGYEVTPGAWSRVAPGSAEQLENLAEKLLKKLDA